MLQTLLPIYQNGGPDAVRAYIAENQLNADPDHVIEQLAAIDRPRVAAQANQLMESILRDLAEHGPDAVRSALLHAGLDAAIADELITQANQQLALERMLQLYRDEGEAVVRVQLETGGVPGPQIDQIIAHLQQHLSDDTDDDGA
jgi:SOS response regulatory protein OraA/RecX